MSNILDKPLESVFGYISVLRESSAALRVIPSTENGADDSFAVQLVLSLLIDIRRYSESHYK